MKVIGTVSDRKHEEKIIFCVGPLHAFYEAKSATLEDILKQSVIITHYHMSEVFERFFERHGYNKKINLIHDLFTTRNLIKKITTLYFIFTLSFCIKEYSRLSGSSA